MVSSDVIELAGRRIADAASHPVRVVPGRFGRGTMQRLNHAVEVTGDGPEDNDDERYPTSTAAESTRCSRQLG